tara:strand:- start:13387 stop:13605 length:219 start_codon:yes stop_codon:yes gene_type:complete
MLISKNLFLFSSEIVNEIMGIIKAIPITSNISPINVKNDKIKIDILSLLSSNIFTLKIRSKNFMLNIEIKIF